MDSILNSIKKLLGLTTEQTDFDEDLIMHINTVFTILNDLGVGPKEGFAIEGVYETWYDYMQDKLQFEKVKTYMALKVKLYFDPPQNSSLIVAIERRIDELEWRLTASAENTTE